MDSKLKNSEQELCMECTTIPATCQCVKCECHLCNDCFDIVHKQFKYTRSHVKEPLSQVPSNSNEMCGAHGDRPVEYYCEDDCSAVCAHCVIVGAHQGHKIITIDQQKQKVAAVIAKAKLLLSSCQRSHQVLKDMCQEVSSNKTTSVLAIEAHFHQITEEISASLNQRKNVLIDQTTRAYEDNLVDLQQRLRLVVEKQETLKQFSTGDLQSLLSKAMLFDDSMPPVEVSESPVVIRCDFDRNCLLDSISDYGQVSVSANINESNEGADNKNVSPRDSKTDFDGVKTNDKHTASSTVPQEYNDIAVSNINMRVLLGLPSSGGMTKLAAPPAASSVQSKVLHGVPSTEDMKQLYGSASVASGTMRDTVMKSKKSTESGSSQPQGVPASSSRASSALSSSESPMSSSPAHSQASPSSRMIKSASSDDVGSTSWESVYLVNIRSPEHFDVQYERDLPKLQKLMDEINQLCAEQSTKTTPSEHIYAEGLPVLAKFTDKQWCRAEVLRTVGHQVEVKFIDYGNTEFVAYDSIQEIPKNFNFFKCPKLSTVCALDGLSPLGGGSTQWSEDSIATFAVITNKLKMLMKVVRQTNKLMFVELAWLPAIEDVIPECRLELVSDVLVFMKLAMRTNSVKRKEHQSQYLQPDLPCKGQHIIVNISFLLEDFQFAIHILPSVKSGSKQPRLNSLSYELQSTYNGAINVDKYIIRAPAKGMAVAAKFNVDGLWYRAKVIELIAGSQVKVLYVDYGNAEVLPITKIRKLAPRFLNDPIQALTCKFSTETSTSYSIIAQASENLRVVGLTVCDILPGPLLVVSLPKSSPATLVSPKREIAKPVTTKQLAKAEPTTKVTSPIKPKQATRSAQPTMRDQARLIEVAVEAKYKPVYVSHVVDPSEIYIQVSSTSEKAELNKLMLELTERYEETTTVPDCVWKKGMNCVVRRCQDMAWYRGEVEEIGPDNDLVKVYMRDYGYREWIETVDLRTMGGCPMLPWYSLRCHMANIVPLSADSHWSQQACEVLYEKICCQTVYVDVKGDGVESSLPVHLYQRELVRGGALTPDKYVFIDVASALVENRLAQFLIVSGASESGSVESEALSPPTRFISTAFKDFLPPKSLLENNLKVAVTHVNSEGVIYVQELSTDLSAFKGIIQKVEEHYAKTKPDPNIIWKIGCPVAAFFDQDATYYRAKITGFTDQGIEVLFVDFGNIEVIQKDCLRLLEDEFMADPIMCYACRLHDITPVNKKTWDDSFSTVVTGLTESKPCYLLIKEKSNDGTLCVDILLPGDESIRNILCVNGLATFCSNGRASCDSPDSKALMDNVTAMSPCAVLPARASQQVIPERVVASPYQSRLMPAIGDHWFVTVTQVDSPNVVFLQHLPNVAAKDPDQLHINEELKLLEELSSVFKHAGDYPPFTEEVCQGAACLALYSDNCWYRAEIIDVAYGAGKDGGDLMAVRYVDYGSFEYIDSTRLRPLPEEHVSCLPMQAVSCTLADIRLPKDKDLFDAAVQQLYSLFHGRELLAVVKGVSYYDSEITADLYDMNEFKQSNGSLPPLVYKDLIDAGVLELSVSLSVNSLEEFCDYNDGENADEE